MPSSISAQSHPDTNRQAKPMADVTVTGSLTAPPVDNRIALAASSWAASRVGVI